MCILISDHRYVVAVELLETLKCGDRLSHISPAQFRQEREIFRRDSERLRGADLGKPEDKGKIRRRRKKKDENSSCKIKLLLGHGGLIDRLEAELCASARQWVDHSAHIVANETEARVLAVHFHRSPKRSPTRTKKTENELGSGR